MATTTTSLKLDRETKERVQKIAESRRRTAHWIMRDAIDQYLEREETREQLHQDALAAFEDYKKTGLHVTSEEADAWLETLESGEKTDPPACHV